jgi:hypothetical protein
MQAAGQLSVSIANVCWVCRTNTCSLRWPFEFDGTGLGLLLAVLQVSNDGLEGLQGFEEPLEDFTKGVRRSGHFLALCMQETATTQDSRSTAT